MVNWAPGASFNPNDYGRNGLTVALAKDFAAKGFFGPGSNTALTINPAVRLDSSVTIKDGYANANDSAVVTFTSLTSSGNFTLTTASTTKTDGSKVYYAIGTLDKFTGSLAVSAKSEVAIDIVNVATTPADGACVVPATVGTGAAINGDLKLYVN